MTTRGSIIFHDGRVRVEAEVARLGNPLQGWDKALANGDYLVVREK